MTARLGDERESVYRKMSRHERLAGGEETAGKRRGERSVSQADYVRQR